MENANSSLKKSKAISGISICAAILFAGLYFFNPKTVVKTEVHSLTNTVTNDGIQEMPNEVEKTVKVAAEIPQEYIDGKALRDAMLNARVVKTDDQMLFGMKDVKVAFNISDDIKKVMSEDEIKAKYELILRRNNISVNSDSHNVILVDIEGFLNSPEQTTLVFDMDESVTDSQWVVRNLEWRSGFVKVWEKGSFGTVGKEKASEALLQKVEKLAEIFANDFLSANQSTVKSTSQ
jgi:hypothetical protein